MENKGMSKIDVLKNRIVFLQAEIKRRENLIIKIRDYLGKDNFTMIKYLFEQEETSNIHPILTKEDSNEKTDSS